MTAVVLYFFIIIVIIIILILILMASLCLPALPLHPSYQAVGALLAPIHSFLSKPGTLLCHEMSRLCALEARLPDYKTLQRDVIQATLGRASPWDRETVLVSRVPYGP